MIKVLIALAILALAAHYGRQVLAVHACLDHGGEWNYDTDQCSLE
jgi:hypothetical protein